MSLSDFSAAPSLSLSPPPARRRPPIDLALPRPPYAPGPARQHSHSDEVQRIRERIRDRVRANSGPSQPRNAANNGVIDLTLSDSDDEPVVVASRITAPARAPRNVAQVPGLFVPRNRVRVEVEVPRRVELPARERRVPSEEARDNLRVSQTHYLPILQCIPLFESRSALFTPLRFSLFAPLAIDLSLGRHQARAQALIDDEVRAAEGEGRRRLRAHISPPVAVGQPGDRPRLALGGAVQRRGGRQVHFDGNGIRRRVVTPPPRQRLVHREDDDDEFIPPMPGAYAFGGDDDSDEDDEGDVEEFLGRHRNRRRPGLDFRRPVYRYPPPRDHNPVGLELDEDGPAANERFRDLGAAARPGRYAPVDPADPPEAQLAAYRRELALIREEARMERARREEGGLRDRVRGMFGQAGRFVHAEDYNLNILGMGLGLGGAGPGPGRMVEMDLEAKLAQVECPKSPERLPGYEGSFDIQAKEPIVIDGDEDAQGNERYLECPGCLDPLRISSGYRSADDRVWALRCGHLVDQKCLRKLSTPVTPEQIKNVTNMSSGESGVLTILEDSDVSRPSKKRRKKGKTASGPLIHVWKCPVAGCARLHTSRRQDDTLGVDESDRWVQTDDGGAIAGFM